LVCADNAWVPSAGGALAVLALGPLLEAGLVVEPPAILLSFEDSEEEVAKGLMTVAYNNGFSFNCEDHDLGTVRGAYCIAKFSNPKSFDEIDDIYDERYGRSFFVRRTEDQPWVKELVEGKPWACYRLELSEGESESLLSIHIMADIGGKAGAGQFIHTMNIMCGFEESLGLI
jgi:N-acetyl-gamma-glutamylphosphate reductase